MPKTPGMKAYVARKKAEAEAAMTPEKFNALINRLLPPGTYYNTGRRRRFVPQPIRSLPSFAAGGAMNFGFNEQEIAGFGVDPISPAPSSPMATAPPSAPPPPKATIPVAEIPAIPATTSPPAAPVVTPTAAAPAPISVGQAALWGATQPQAAAAAPQPAPIVPSAPTPAQISAEQAALWGATQPQPQPAAAAPQPAPIVPSAPTPAQISAERAALWGVTQPQPAAAAPQPAPITPAAPFPSQMSAEQAALWGMPLLAPAPQLAAAEPHAVPGSEFSSVQVEQFTDSELASLDKTDIRLALAVAEAERLAFERDFGPIVAQEQLEAAQRQQREQFEKDFGGLEAEAAQERLAKERLQRGQLEQFRKEFPELHAEELAELSVLARHEFPEAFPNTESSYFPVIPGTHEEYLKQGLNAIRRHGWDGFADLAVVLEIEFEAMPNNKRAEGPQYDPVTNRIYYDETSFLQPARDLRNVQPVGADSAINGVPAHELTHGVREFLKTRMPEALELLEHGEGGAAGNTTITLDRGTPNERPCPVGGGGLLSWPAGT